MSDITLTKREIELIRILSGKKGYMETDVLCDMMDIKPRTLRECIRQFRENHGDRTGVRITAGIGTGYKLEIIDQEKYHALLKSMLETETASQFLMPVDQEDRVSYIIRLLLTADDYRKSEDIAEQMYISRSTFAEDLRQVRNRLAKMNLSLASAPRRGIRIEGDEINIRNAIAEYCFQLSNYEEGQVKMLSGYFDEETMEMVRKTLYDLLREYDFTMSDASFRNLVIHLLIAMNRIHSGTYISSLEVNQLNLRDTKEWKIACELYRRLSETTGLSIPSAEIGYVTIHLRGKRIISDEAEMIMYPETLNLLTTVMKAVEERYGIDFTGDIELYSALAMHLQPLIERASYGLHIENPLLEKISSENPAAFDMAALAAEQICRIKGMRIDENEIGYLALHFALAMERLKTKEKKNILVICASGAGTSRMLAYRIRKYFRDGVDRVDTMSYYALRENPSQGYDLIVSTVPITFSVDAPVVRISEMPDSGDMQKVEGALTRSNTEDNELAGCFDEDLFFAGMTMKTPAEAIRFLSNQLRRKVSLPENFDEMVLAREALSSTAIGFRCAFPHPNRLCSDCTKTAVLCLKEPMDWFGKEVQLIFLSTLQKEEDNVFRRHSRFMADLMSDRKKIIRIMSAQTFESLRECIAEDENTGLEEDIFQ